MKIKDTEKTKSGDDMYSLEESTQWKKFINMFMSQWRIKTVVIKIVGAKKKL